MIHILVEGSQSLS